MRCPITAGNFAARWVIKICSRSNFTRKKADVLDCSMLQRFAKWDGKIPSQVREERQVSMLSKRLIVCLDVREGKLAKSIKFVDTKDIGDPVAKARQYYEDGADELVFYDINASRANRDITLKFVEAVAAQIFIPFSVGGGIRSVEDATKLRLAGAEKVNVNSAAVKRKELISEISGAIGAQSTILSMDVKKTTKTKEIPSGYEIVINDGTVTTGSGCDRMGENR